MDDVEVVGGVFDAFAVSVGGTHGNMVLRGEVLVYGRKVAVTRKKLHMK